MRPRVATVPAARRVRLSCSPMGTWSCTWNAAAGAAALVARPVAQSLSGIMIYDVEDTGQQATPGSGIRPDKTNIELSFHNDNNYNRAPPDYVGLLCLRPARRVGTGLHALDRWLEAQPQLPLLIAAAAVAVLLFH